MSILSKLTALITAGNTKTGKSEDNLTDVVQDLIDGYGGGGTPTLQTKTETYTPTENVQTDTITPDPGYDGLDEVDITVNAISDTYVGSAITQRDSTDLSASGATVTAPAGYYAAAASKAVASGTEGTPTASKGAVDNHSITVTPSVTNSEGYIAGGTHTGTGVSVAASELVSGTLEINANGTDIDVTEYEKVDVNVSGGGGTVGDDYVTARLKNQSPTSLEWTLENGDTVYPANISAQNLTVHGATNMAVSTPGMTGVISLPDVTAIPNNCWTGGSFNPSVIYIPKAAPVGSFASNANANKTNLVKVVMGGSPFAGSGNLNRTPNLKALVIKADSVPTLAYPAALTASGIGDNADAYIYVPSSLYSSYIADTNWSAFSSKFRKIEDYPLIDAPDTWLPT